MTPVVVTLAERHGVRVMDVLLNRPQARNAITVALAEALHAALARAATEADVVVVRGAGGHFCAGGDVAEVGRLRDGGPGGLRHLLSTFVAACELIAELPVPVVAAVEGWATAGGFELVQSVDIAVLADDAVLADNHVRVGMVPAGGGSQRLPRIVGAPRALGHLLTGDRLTAAEAVAWGLAYRAVPAAELDDAVDALVATLARRDRAALARTKRLVREGLRRPLGDGLELELATALAHLAEAAPALTEEPR